MHWEVAMRLPPTQYLARIRTGNREPRGPIKKLTPTSKGPTWADRLVSAGRCSLWLNLIALRVLFARQKRLLALVDALGGEVGALDFQKLLFLYCREVEETPVELPASAWR